MTTRAAVPDGKAYRALIFDWDGTLVDSNDVCFTALARAMADAGAQLDPGWYWPRQAMASPDMLLVWEREFGHLPEPVDDIVRRCRRYVRAAAHDLRVIDDVALVAHLARQRGQRLGIGSNSSDSVVAAGLEATGLAALFDAVVTSSDVPRGRGKPEPDIFLLAARRLDAEPADCLVFDDTDMGVAAALSAGMTAYHVRTGVLSTPIGAAPRHRRALLDPVD